ncbi:hypothetical protein [Streptomyces sp. NPDC002088]|uniref:hypothetical protein n=1 Tax=Streptomyces sp. NPDC002088 TaxID=3154665 RepID=UPI00332D9A87
MADIEEGRTVHARVPYVHDKEIVVSTVQSPSDGLFVDLREYIPSLDAFGRGLTFPLGLLDEVLKGVESAWHENGGGASEEDGTEGRQTGKA